jgi:glucose/arabinose dehydrogenase
MPESPFNVGALANNGTIARAVRLGISLPVDVVDAGDDSGRLYVVQQGGLIRIIRNGAMLSTPFLDLTAKVVVSHEQGLLGLAFHPNYAVNGYFFVYYTAVGNGDLTIERYQRNAANTNIADLSSAKTMLTIPHPGQSNHNAGKLAFGHDGYLYASTGDGGGGNDTPNNAQNLSDGSASCCASTSTRVSTWRRITGSLRPIPFPTRRTSATV